MGEIYSLDCSGLVCPKPVAETKKVLVSMKTGDVCKIIRNSPTVGEHVYYRHVR